jgi:hypothetical protein
MTVIMAPVQSSNIKAIGYDALAFELHVEFKNGKTFAYKYVSSREFNKLLYAESIGKHINQFIKPDKVAFEIFDAQEEYLSSDDVIADQEKRIKKLEDGLLSWAKVIDELVMSKHISSHPSVELDAMTDSMRSMVAEGKDNV